MPYLDLSRKGLDQAKADHDAKPKAAMPLAELAKPEAVGTVLVLSTFAQTCLSLIEI